MYKRQNLTLTFSPALVDFFIYVIDVAAGDKIPRKDGPGISYSDILVINKTDLAPYVHADLEVMRRDSELMRPGKPFVSTNCMTGEGIKELVMLIRDMAPVSYTHLDVYKRQVFSLGVIKGRGKGKVFQDMKCSSYFVVVQSFGT